MATVNVFLPFRALTWTATGTPSPSVSTATARTALKAGLWNGDRASAFKAPVSAYTTRTNNVFFPLCLRVTREATTARAAGGGGGTLTGRTVTMTVPVAVPPAKSVTV